MLLEHAGCRAAIYRVLSGIEDLDVIDDGNGLVLVAGRANGRSLDANEWQKGLYRSFTQVMRL
jgi:hypothetical protein